MRRGTGMQSKLKLLFAGAAALAFLSLLAPSANARETDPEFVGNANEAIDDAYDLADHMHYDHHRYDEGSSCDDLSDGDQLMNYMYRLWLQAKASGQQGLANALSDAADELGDELGYDEFEYGPCPRRGIGLAGYYLGVNAAGAWGSSIFDEPGSQKFNTNGVLFGVTGQVLWPLNAGTVASNGRYPTGWRNQLYWGLAVDVMGGSVSGSTTQNCAVGCKAENTWDVFLRGIVGVERWGALFYGTGGAAVGDIQARVTGFPGVSVTNVGWVAGGGIQKRLDKYWSVKLEYLRLDLGKAECTPQSCGGTASVPFRDNIVRIGIDRKFDP